MLSYPLLPGSIRTHPPAPTCAPLPAIAGDRDGVFYEGGSGPRIAGEASETITTSTQFAIMSMTKIVCTTAALQQVERGLNLDAPVQEYCPDCGQLKVLDGW